LATGVVFTAMPPVVPQVPFTAGGSVVPTQVVPFQDHQPPAAFSW
jgi:hypothetical protein